jgi:hypothetical protein
MPDALNGFFIESSYPLHAVATPDHGFIHFLLSSQVQWQKFPSFFSPSDSTNGEMNPTTLLSAKAQKNTHALLTEFSISPGFLIRLKILSRILFPERNWIVTSLVKAMKAHKNSYSAGVWIMTQLWGLFDLPFALTSRQLAQPVDDQKKMQTKSNPSLCRWAVIAAAL